MKRSQYLIAVSLAVLVALSLRIRSFKTQPQAPSPPTQPSTAPAGLPLEPPDFVLHPRIAPEELDAGPRRLISLAPSITELVCALGMRDRLVGRTPYCTYPPDIESVPAVGALLDTNYEKIKSLKPDLILITENSTAVATELQQLGLRYLAVPHNTLDDVYLAIERVGNTCVHPKTATMLIDAIRSDIERLRRETPPGPAGGRRSLVVLGTLPVPPQAVFVAGPGSFLDALLQYAGQRNAATEVLKASHDEIPLEKLPFLDPDLIIEFRDPVRPQDMQDLYEQWARVGPISAIRGRRVCSVGGMEWLSAGPRIAIELHRFIRAVAETR